MDPALIPLRILVALFILSEIAGAVLGAVKLYQFRHMGVLIRSKGILLAGIAFEIIASLVASAGEPNLKHNTWYLWWYLGGRVIRCAALWWFVIALLGFTLPPVAAEDENNPTD